MAIRIWAGTVLASSILLLAACAEAQVAFSYQDLLALKRVQEPEVSPDGKSIVFTLREPDLEKNKFSSHLWLVSSDGGAPRRLTSHEKGESHPKWSPDGRMISFLSERSGSQQIWILPADGGEAFQLTTLSTGADNQMWSPDGNSILFTSDVWPDLADDAAQKKRAGEKEASGVKAQVIDSLLHRHWTEWREGRRFHLFIVPAGGARPAASSPPGAGKQPAPRDLTPGDFDAPPLITRNAPRWFDISPDGKTVAFTRSPARNTEAWSTDTAVCLVSTEGGAIRNITESNKGWDGAPCYSPDGKFIAFRSQEREGYEADRMRLALFDVAGGKVTFLAGDLDRSVDEIAWSPDSRTIYFSAEDRGKQALYAVEPSASAHGRLLFRGSQFSDLSIPRNGAFAVASVASLVHPAEVSRISLSSPAGWKALTSVNDAALEARGRPTVESIEYPGALGAAVQAWLLKPPGFDAKRKYPCLLLIHGGPQGAWNDEFSFRWNMMTYAAHGYVVLAPNPHGSSGFGQAFAEQISGDWGGAVFEDIMKAADWAAAQDYIDRDRLGAAGASFGGYMVNWILGHTDRFKVLVSHAGVYNLESEYGVTEELWFPEWEFKGTPWKNPALYEKFSPHRFAANFKTPTLVSHGEIDYRVPIDQGLQLFTALKRQGIDSRLLYFPDEGHWVLKLKNSRLFYETVFDWVDRYLRP